MVPAVQRGCVLTSCRNNFNSPSAETPARTVLRARSATWSSRTVLPTRLRGTPGPTSLWWLLTIFMGPWLVDTSLVERQALSEAAWPHIFSEQRVTGEATLHQALGLSNWVG